MVSITNADLELYVTENSVTTVIWKDNARVLAFGDVVRITDRDGIRYEFLYTDVIAPTSPAYSSAEELADEINTYLITIPGGGGGTITDVTATAPLTSSGGATPDISTLMTSGKLIGRHSSGSGVFQEITLGTNLSLSGDTLNAAGGGGGGLLSGNATQVSTGVYTTSITGVTAYSAGEAYLIKFDTANDGASTININALGAKNIYKNTNVPIASGDIKANQEIMIVYDGTNFQAIGLIASQLLAYVHNAEGAVINKGQVVYAHEASGNKMSVKLARADADATSAKTIGLVYDSSIGIGGEGYIIIQGVIEGINTAAFNAGDTLYLSGTTFGGVTATKPQAPTHLVYVGIVERANAGNGQIYVRCQNGYELDEIHDVLITTPQTNQLLTYEATPTPLWKNKSLGTILGGSTSQYVRGDGSLATFPTIPTVGNSIQALTGDVTASASSPSQSVAATLASNFKVSQIVTVLDGQGGVIQIGRGNNFLSIPFNGTITGWTILSSVSGSIEVAFWKDTYANYPPTVADNVFSPNPTLSAATKNVATGLSIAVTAGDIIIPNVVSVTTCTNVTIAIQITRS